MLLSGGHTITVEKTAEIVDMSNITYINTAISEIVKVETVSEGNNLSGGNNDPLEEKPRS